MSRFAFECFAIPSDREMLTGLVCIVLGVGTFALILVIGYFAQASQTRKDYYASLKKLKQDPDNPNLRERTLALGRNYANATEEADEASIANDINAACAGRGGRSRSREVGLSADERLARLQALQAKGAVTAKEYRERRQQILDEL